MGSIEYHLEELNIALDKDDERRVLPDILDSDKAILDIGCGIGLWFIDKKKKGAATEAA